MTYSADRRDEFGLVEFATTVKERWWLVLLTVVVFGGVAFLASAMLSPRYKATAELAYQPPAMSTLGSAADASVTTPHNINSDVLVLRTPGFADRVASSMGAGRTGAQLLASVGVTSNPDLELVQITGKDGDSAGSALIANAFATEFVRYRQEQIAASLRGARDLISQRIKAMTPAEAASTYGAALKEQLDSLDILLTVQRGDYQVLQQAIPPTSAYFPRPFLNLELGLIVGLIAGIGVALLVSHLDARIKDAKRIEQGLGVPVLASIPLVRAGLRSAVNDSRHVGFANGNGRLLESVRMLRSALKLLGFGRTDKVLLITSAVPGEGKTGLAINLALSLALSGDRVIIVDADLRNPSVHRYLNISNSSGLRDALLGNKDWSRVAQAVDIRRFLPVGMSGGANNGSQRMVPKILCLTSGSSPTDSWEIIETEKMTELMKDLKAVSDYVIIDGPPLLAASDSTILAHSADASVLVTRLRAATPEQTLEAKRLLERAKAKLLGAVATGVKTGSRTGNYYYYSGHSKHLRPTLR